MAASLKCSSVWRRLPLFYGIFSCAFLVLTVPGAGALTFVSKPAVVLPALLGMNVDINCTTDEPSATVTLLHQPSFTNWVERAVTPNKLILRGQVFTLLNVIVSDGGRYNCKATYKNQTIRWPTFYGTIVFRQGQLPDHFKLVPEKPIIVLRGGTGQILCEAEGVSVSKLQWKRKTTSSGIEQSVPDNMVTNVVDQAENLVKAILKITNAKPQDTGEYKCLLTAYGKQDRKLTSVRVDDITPPTISPYNGEKTINEGVQKVIKCVAKASPRPSANWYRNGKKLNITNCTSANDKSCENVIYEVYEENPGLASHTTFITQVLKIRSASYPRDQGKFVCKATNGYDPPAELDVDLNVQAVPVLTKHSDPVFVVDGKATKVSCSLDKANPLPTFMWEYQIQNSRDTDVCPPVGSKWAVVPGNLVLTPTNTPTNRSVVEVKKDQPAFYYRCNATNTVGIDSHVVTLVRLAKIRDLVEYAPNSITQLNERSTLHLVCFDLCGSYCPFPQFAKDGLKLSPENDARVNITYFRKTDQEPENRLVLTIKDLKLNDSGNYRCISGAKPSIFDDVYVTVSKPLAFVKQPQNILIGYIGQTLVINCSTDDEDAAVSLLHKRHPFAAFIERKPKVSKLWKKGQVFSLLNLDLRDAGIYTCEARNRVNETIRWPAGTGYLLLSQEPLAFLKPPPIILQGYMDQKVEIDCSTNDEDAKVSLLHKNHPLAAFTKRELEENKLSKRGQTFTLLNVDLSDAGIYACEANNQASRMIRWPPGTGYLILFQVELPRHFVLRPTTPISVQQGEEAKVICESEGVSVTKLQWKRQTAKGDVPVPDNMVTVVKDRSNNRVRATLTITNTQPQDGGVYKCVLMVFNKTDYKQATILVKDPLAFPMQPKTILLGYIGQNLEINCSTNDENATVSLLHKRHPLAAFIKRKPEANKLLLQGKLFTLLNLDLRDDGIYSCEANDQANNRIRWPLGTGYVILSRAKLPDYFVLKPEIMIVLKGEDVNVTCESEGVSVTELQWKKQTDSGDVSVPDGIVTVIKDRATNLVRAILKITNAQVEDGGVYKCVLRVFEKTGYRSTKIVIANN